MVGFLLYVMDTEFYLKMDSKAQGGMIPCPLVWAETAVWFAAPATFQESTGIFLFLHTAPVSSECFHAAQCAAQLPASVSAYCGVPCSLCMSWHSHLVTKIASGVVKGCVPDEISHGWDSRPASYSSPSWQLMKPLKNVVSVVVPHVTAVPGLV